MQYIYIYIWRISVEYLYNSYFNIFINKFNNIKFSVKNDWWEGQADKLDLGIVDDDIVNNNFHFLIIPQYERNLDYIN